MRRVFKRLMLCIELTAIVCAFFWINQRGSMSLPIFSLVEQKHAKDAVVRASSTEGEMHTLGAASKSTSVATPDGLPDSAYTSDYLFPPCSNATPSATGGQQQYGFVGPFDYMPEYRNPCWMERRYTSTRSRARASSENACTSCEMSSRVRCVPYFYLIAAPKSGSTDLFYRITRHPQVASPRHKETKWFDRSRFTGYPDPETFLTNFDVAARVISRSTVNGSTFHHIITGDGSPTYFFDNRHWHFMPGNEGCTEPRVTVASYIHHLYPQARLILILRNPVDRMFSDYLYNGYHTREAPLSNENFHHFVKQAIGEYNACFARYSLRTCANDVKLRDMGKLPLKVGLYDLYIRDWLALFPRHQMLFLTTENFSRYPEGTLHKVFDFLGLDALSQPQLKSIFADNTTKNSGRKRYHNAGPLLPATRTLLEEFYRPFNKRLVELLGDSDFLWF